MEYWFVVLGLFVAAFILIVYLCLPVSGETYDWWLPPDEDESAYTHRDW